MTKQADIHSKDKLTGYVLAGGRSSRMGSDKALLTIDGETFLGRAVRTLTGICERRVRIVINEKQEPKFKTAFPGGDFIFDLHPDRGALGGIHAALRDCPTECAVVLAVDLPFVNDGAIEKLARLALEDNCAAIVPEQADGRLQPLCAVYRPAGCLAEINNLMDAGRSVSVRELLGLVPLRLVGQKDISTDRRIFFNVNHPLDYEAVG